MDKIIRYEVKRDGEKIAFGAAIELKYVLSDIQAVVEGESNIHNLDGTPMKLNITVERS